MHDISAYMFPGQGSQYKGMGADLFNLYQTETKKANEILGYSVEELCLEDKFQRLNQTQYTQPALYLISCLAYLNEINHNQKKPTFVVGHSLGEYAALFAAGIFDLYTGLLIVKKRGELMADIKNGSMMAVIGVNALNANKILYENNIRTIDVANYNTSQQIVLSGVLSDLETGKKILEEQGLKCILLNVSGAFHSRYMESVRINFMRFLKNYQFSQPELQAISSSTTLECEYDYLLENLGYQLVRPVRWVQTITYLKSKNVTQFTEIGPGDVLKRLNHHILANHA